MEDSNIIILLRSLLEKWQNSEKKWEKNEQFSQEKEQQWILAETEYNQNAAEESEMHWKPKDLEWLRMEEQYPAPENIFCKIQQMLDNPDESLLIYADVLEFQLEFKKRKKHWDKRKRLWLQKQSWYYGRQKLYLEMNQNTAHYEDKLKTAQEQLAEWFQAAQDWSEKEKIYQNNEKEFNEKRAEWQQEANLRLAFQEAYEKREKIWTQRNEAWEEEKNQLVKGDSELCQEHEDLKETYNRLLEAKCQWDVEVTNLKRTLEEKTRNEEELQLKEKEWMERESEYLQILQEYQQREIDAEEEHKEWIEQYEDNVLDLKERFLSMLSTLEQRQTDCDNRENTLRGLDIEYQQKSVQHEAELKTAKEQLAEWAQKEQDWLEKEKMYQNNEKEFNEKRAEWQQEANLRLVFQEAYEKREKIWIQRKEAWEKEKNQLVKEDSELCQQHEDLKEAYNRLLEEKWQWDVEVTNLKRTLEEKTRNEEELKEKEEEANLRLVLQEAYETREKIWIQRQKIWEQEKNQLVKTDSESGQKHQGLLEEKCQWDMEMTELKRRFEETLQLKEKAWIERELQLLETLHESQQNEIIAEQKQEELTQVTQDLQEMMSALKKEQNECQKLKSEWEEKQRTRLAENQTVTSEAQEENLRSEAVEPQNETPDKQTKKKKKRKGGFWRCCFGR